VVIGICVVWLPHSPAGLGLLTRFDMIWRKVTQGYFFFFFGFELSQVGTQYGGEREREGGRERQKNGSYVVAASPK
jgi:hypothetical protein